MSDTFAASPLNVFGKALEPGLGPVVDSWLEDLQPQTVVTAGL